jgi:2-hydroxy-6-oxonona-2,4-dienedioate hydrolase
MGNGFADINGARIYYEVDGAGFPFVMVHAGIAHSGMWDDQFREFAKDYRVIRYDMRGYGQSAPVDGEYALRRDLYGLLKFLGVEKAHVMGCSMGGGGAMDFALDYPEMVASLILVGASPRGFEYDVQPPPQWDELVKAFREGDLDRAAELDIQVWFDGRGRTPDQVDAVARNKIYEMDKIALQFEKLELGKPIPLDNPPAAKRLSEIKVPVLVIVGDLDQEDIIAAADFMVENLPDARKVVMAGTAHVPNMERPDEFNRYVRDFLKRS